MSVIKLDINRRDYEIVCADGEEDHLLRLSFELDRRVKDLSKVSGTGNQSMLLLMAALQLVDDLYEAKVGGATASGTNIQAEVDTVAASVLSQVSDKLEDIAKT